jgi:hypothetical protein
MARVKTYAKVGMHNLARVLDGLPTANAQPTKPEQEVLRATGTDMGSVLCPQKSPQSGAEKGMSARHGATMTRSRPMRRKAESP